jgi:3-amino-5-hydroxybenzoic acid synthesis related protein
MLKSVIFDLDGVLIDSEPLMRFAFEATFRQIIGEGVAPIEQFLEHMGESFPRIMERIGMPRTLWEPYRELCQQNIERIRLFPAARNLLQQIASLDLRMALLTGKDYVRTIQILDHFQLAHFFDEVVASDQLYFPKPNPEGIFRALHLLDTSADAAVMVGDAVNDIVCAQQAGVTAIAVTWGIKPERVQTLCSPDYIVHEWDALFETIQGLAGPIGAIRAKTLEEQRALS